MNHRILLVDGEKDIVDLMGEVLRQDRLRLPASRIKVDSLLFEL